jgi:type IV secretion system protein VirB1
MILELAVVAQLAARCAPSVAFETLAAVMRAESGFQPFAIGVNGPDGGPVFPASREAAMALAAALIERQGRSVDLGLMQVNSANLPRLGLSVAEAFEPCRNIAAGARILRDGYAAPAARSATRSRHSASPSPATTLATRSAASPMAMSSAFRAPPKSWCRPSAYVAKPRRRSLRRHLPPNCQTTILTRPRSGTCGRASPTPGGPAC